MDHYDRVEQANHSISTYRTNLSQVLKENLTLRAKLADISEKLIWLEECNSFFNWLDDQSGIPFQRLDSAWCVIEEALDELMFYTKKKL